MLHVVHHAMRCCTSYAAYCMHVRTRGAAAPTWIAENGPAEASGQPIDPSPWRSVILARGRRVDSADARR